LSWLVAGKPLMMSIGVSFFTNGGCASFIHPTKFPSGLQQSSGKSM